MKFLRNLLASCLGTFIALGLIFGLFVIIVSSFDTTEEVNVNDNTVLEISLDKIIKDYAPKNDDYFENLMSGNDKIQGLNEILNAIENAKFDTKIKGISLRTSYISAGIAQLQAIRKKLAEFKETGKFIKSYADYYDQANYYFSSVSDSIFVNPIGSVNFKGLTSEVLFFKDFQTKYGVKMEVIRHGKYKSAVEPFLENEMSDNNREQITSFLNSIWDEVVDEIGESRNISPLKLNFIADNLLSRNAELALENNIVDGSIYVDEYVSKLKMEVGIEDDDDLNKISLNDYISTGKGRISNSSSDKIAVIYAQGEIIYGKGNIDYIGPELIINALKKARENKSIKAIVLRVNSPGGSALASELIWREVELTKPIVPVVVSMGNYAASGGYYIACGADKIYAEPTTITGSIGVFGMFPNIYELSQNIGINSSTVKTNKSPDYSFYQPMTDEFRNVSTESVEFVYDTFLDHVSNGRNMTIQQIDSIAQGRVWTGLEAKEIGLIDELGGLKDAIVEAASLAGITDYRTRNYPSYKVDYEEIFSGFPFGKSKEDILLNELGDENYEVYKNLKHVFDNKGVQARLPYLINIK